jgi:hypothetical protein
MVKHLLKEIEILTDENESLWGMLSEIHESDKAAKKVMDEQQEKAMLEFLAKTKPVGDA